jgi:hypothetical protein
MIANWNYLTFEHPDFENLPNPSLLKRNNCIPLLFVLPSVLERSVKELTAYLSQLRKAEIPISLALVLEREQGYFFNPETTDCYEQYIHESIRLLRSKGIIVDELFLDFEPSLEFSRTGQEKPFFNPLRFIGKMDRNAFMVHRTRISQILQGIQNDVQSIAGGLMPFTLFDLPKGKIVWQDFCGSPVHDIGLTKKAYMLYSPMFLELPFFPNLEETEAFLLLIARRIPLRERKNAILFISALNSKGEIENDFDPDHAALVCAMFHKHHFNNFGLYDYRYIQDDLEAWLYSLNGLSKGKIPAISWRQHFILHIFYFLGWCLELIHRVKAWISIFDRFRKGISKRFGGRIFDEAQINSLRAHDGMDKQTIDSGEHNDN